MSRKDFLNILDKYENNVKEVYFSLPIGDKYHTRRSVMKNLSPDKTSFSDFVSFLEEIKDRKMELCLALNTHMLNEKDVFTAIEKIKNKVEINSIVTFNRFAENIKKKYPEINLALSIHEGIIKFSDADRINPNISTVVIGNSEIRNLPLIRFIKDKGLKIKHLLNTGCNCIDFCRDSRNCKSNFEKNLSNFGYNFLYACQSIMPYEFHKYLQEENMIDIFKVANRDCDYSWLDSCLNSYINNIEYEVITRDKYSYSLWAGYSYLCTPTAFKAYDYDEIFKIKELLWDLLKKDNTSIDSYSNTSEELLNLLKAKCEYSGL